MQSYLSTNEVYKKTLERGNNINENTTIEKKRKQSSIVKERKNSHIKVLFWLLSFKGQKDGRERIEYMVSLLEKSIPFVLVFTFKRFKSTVYDPPV